jgi:hypothetical protein
MPTARTLRLVVGACAVTAALGAAAPALAGPPVPHPITCPDACLVDPTFYKTWLTETEAWAGAVPTPHPITCTDECYVDPASVKAWEQAFIDWAT